MKKKYNTPELLAIQKHVKDKIDKELFDDDDAMFGYPMWAVIYYTIQYIKGNDNANRKTDKDMETKKDNQPA